MESTTHITCRSFSLLGRKSTLGRVHQLHGGVVTQHLVQLPLRFVQRVFVFFPSGWAGWSETRLWFAAQINSALPKILILFGQGFTDDEERDRNIVFFAEIQNFGYMLPFVAVVHGQGDLRNLPVTVKNGEFFRSAPVQWQGCMNL